MSESDPRVTEKLRRRESRQRAEAARARLVSLYREEAQALQKAAAEIEGASLDDLSRTLVVGRGARMRAAEDELDEALVALE